MDARGVDAKMGVAGFGPADLAASASEVGEAGVSQRPQVGHKHGFGIAGIATGVRKRNEVFSAATEQSLNERLQTKLSGVMKTQLTVVSAAARIVGHLSRFRVQAFALRFRAANGSG